MPCNVVVVVVEGEEERERGGGVRGESAICQRGSCAGGGGVDTHIKDWKKNPITVCVTVAGGPPARNTRRREGAGARVRWVVTHRTLWLGERFRSASMLACT
jgi:hypothetical protein